MSEVSQPKLIETIEKALEAATTAPWVMIDDQLLGADQTTIGTIYDEENQRLISWCPEWLRALLEEVKRLDTKCHVDMNNYRSQVQTWQQEHDSQIVSLRTELSAKNKVLEWYASEEKYSSKPSDDPFEEWDSPDIHDDNGEKARIILKEYEVIPNETE